MTKKYEIDPIAQTRPRLPLCGNFTLTWDKIINLGKVPSGQIAMSRVII